MSQPPPPPRRRNAPVVVYPGEPPAGGAGPEGQAPRSGPRPGPGPGSGAGGGRRQPPSGGPPSDKRRRNLLIGGVAALLVIAILAVVVLSGGGGGGKNAPTFKASTAVGLRAGAAKVEGVNFSKAVQLSTDTQNKILSTLGTYVENAIVEPLRKGKAVDTALASTFDAAAAPKATGPDRGLLADEGLPKAVGAIKVTTPAVPLSGLSDFDGNIILVNAGVDFHIISRAANGTTRIQRTGSFVFAPDAGGAWKITAWTITVTRNGAGVATTPTTAPAATATTLAGK